MGNSRLLDDFNVFLAFIFNETGVLPQFHLISTRFYISQRQKIFSKGGLG